MREVFQRLLEATIEHLEWMREAGVRQVPVAPETLASLRGSPGGINVNKYELTPKPGRRPEAAPDRAVRVPGGTAQRSAVAGLSAGALRPATVPVGSRKSELPLAATVGGEQGAREAALRALQGRVQTCVKCAHLASSRRNVVFGVGNPQAELMFVGEAPGADEDLQGEPFVGRAGQLLTRIIQAMGLERNQVYIGNVLKCRPDTPGQSAGNRKPTPSEMVTCLPYLEEQIAIIQPKVLVALGMTAIEGLLGKQAATASMGRLRGNWLEFRGIPLMATYHPAYLLRNQSLSEKRKVWEDMLRVMERLEMPISEKQRGFFLKAMGQ